MAYPGCVQRAWRGGRAGGARSRYVPGTSGAQGPAPAALGAGGWKHRQQESSQEGTGTTWSRRQHGQDPQTTCGARSARRCHIGPEPTTDRFVVVYHGLEERRCAAARALPLAFVQACSAACLVPPCARATHPASPEWATTRVPWLALHGSPARHQRARILPRRVRCRVPGNTLAVSPDKPFQGLQAFGTGFLSRFEGSQCPARLLEEITIVDTPGEHGASLPLALRQRSRDADSQQTVGRASRCMRSRHPRSSGGRGPASPAQIAAGPGCPPSVPQLPLRLLRAGAARLALTLARPPPPPAQAC